MVAVTHSPSDIPTLERIIAGLSEEDAARVRRAFDAAAALYGDAFLPNGEPIMGHTLGMALIITGLELDADTRIAALFFSAHARMKDARDMLLAEYGQPVAQMVEGLHHLNGLRVVGRSLAQSGSAVERRAQKEILRKMLLAMVEDVRVVLLRLASRTQTLRWYARHSGPARLEVARESLDIYAPLANRLGVWQLKWELEDRSFFYLEPEAYKRIAALLDERRAEREEFILQVRLRLDAELVRAGIEADVSGRAKHIYSIWNKMQKKRLDFSRIFDVHALRVLVDDVKDCYAALGVVHALWAPLPQEFADYIAQPKGNQYQSLHTVVMADDGRPMEVQIRTREMHSHAELGFAAHWRYKEGAASGGEYDEKIALLRELLSWRDEIAESPDWVAEYKRAALDDTIYAITPQGKVVDLPVGATPVDFAYRLHTDLGHRCRGAKVDGQLVQLNTPLKSGQRVEIVTAKQGGPSRDWLNPQLGILVSARAKQKVKQWFAKLDEEATQTAGRAFVTRELAREGSSGANLDMLAATLGYRDPHGMFLAAGRGELGPRAISVALRGEAPAPTEPPATARARSKSPDGGVLVEGVGKLLTTLGNCCKPVPPDLIGGFVTRGRGVSIHRPDCLAFQKMAQRHPERLITAQWGSPPLGERRAYAVDIRVEAADRQGLLRDISDVLSREKINVTAVNTMSKNHRAFMGFTIEVSGLDQLQRALTLIAEVPSVAIVRRG